MGQFLKIIFVALVSYLSGVAFLLLWMRAEMVSDHPFLSLLTRAVFVGVVFLSIFLKKREFIVWSFLLSFPFCLLIFNGLSVFQLFAILLFLVYLKDVLLFLRTIAWPKFGIIFGFLLMVLFYTTVTAHSVRAAVTQLVTVCFAMIVGLVLRVYLRSDRDLICLLRCLAIVLVFGVFVAVYQYVFGVNSINLFMGSYNVNTALYQGVRRIPSFFEDAQVAGQYFSIASLIILGMLAQKKFSSLLLWVLSFFALVGLFLTVSRLAIISFVFGGVFFLVWAKLYRQLLTVILLGIFAFICLHYSAKDLFSNSLFVRFDLSNQGESAQFRSAIWESSFEIIKENPFGVGLGSANLYDAGTKVGAIFLKGTREGGFAHFESSYLELLYAVGWVGFGLFFLIILGVYRSAIRSISRAKNKVLLISVVMALSVWLLTIGIAPMIFLTQPLFIFVLLVVIIDYLKRRENFQERADVF